ncbi:hypothetical protein [Algiphilus sp.]|uniref:hypothetical protein n=1 Tax=Algiphilus sp. TaxID=1872431 RepID=UPI0025BF1F63|nr:hypothetical protein [Algiphilus sp.]MCK5769497.1 hypothetical protein [Algiphilus sp.]
MSFTHAHYARAIRQTLRSTRRQLDYEVRTGQTHPLVARDCLAALEQCAEHHEAAARAQRRAEAHQEDVTHAQH